MTSAFDERKKAFENKFKLDADTQFKLQARAVRLFGLWAAAQLGIEGEAADAYAGEVVDSDFDEPGIQDVLRKVKHDFDVKGVAVTEDALTAAYNVQLEEAKKSFAE